MRAYDAMVRVVLMFCIVAWLIGWKWMLILLTMILLATMFTTAAVAHDAPKGWKYPYECCSSFDCREVGSRIKVTETEWGYKISSTGEIVSYKDPRIKNSPDGEFHWCSLSGSDQTGTICLFVPPRGY